MLVRGDTIDYNIMHNDTILDSGSLTTDQDGKITLDYTAAGVGDVDVVFSLRSLLQKTYVITDYYEIVDCSNPKDVESQFWPIPVEITGKVKKYGVWGVRLRAAAEYVSGRTLQADHSSRQAGQPDDP